jgi:GH25 family lysozyme M1 (1,4-beta-N-acetylmuramidase)
MAKGIDIYRYQDVTSWHAVKDSGVSYIWVKLTDGGAPAIVRGDRQVAGAKSIGVPVGGYHYAQFNPGPEAQADILIGEVRRLGAIGLVPMLDLEDPFGPDQRARDFGIRFCRRIHALGFRPGVYMNDSMAKALRPDQWGIPGLAIWIARYGSKPAYGGRYDVHQYSSTGSVPGISGAVDMNESYTNAHFTSAAPPLEEDMPWTEADFNTPLFTDNAGTPQARTVRFRDVMAELREGNRAQNAALQQALKLLADNPDNDVTENRLREIFREVVKAEALPALTDVLRQGLDEIDDEKMNELSDLFLAKLGGALSSVQE